MEVTNNWKSNVTHVISATDEQGGCGRSLKVLMAILGGKWIVGVDCKCHFLVSFAIVC